MTLLDVFKLLRLFSELSLECVPFFRSILVLQPKRVEFAGELQTTIFGILQLRSELLKLFLARSMPLCKAFEFLHFRIKLLLHGGPLTRRDVEPLFESIELLEFFIVSFLETPQVLVLAAQLFFKTNFATLELLVRLNCLRMILLDPLYS